MYFECEICNSFADDGDILNHICLNCIDSINTVSVMDCGVSNSCYIDSCTYNCE